jgi:arginine decarboxylase
MLNLSSDGGSLFLMPKRVFLTSGCGHHKDKLVSFEFALRDAGIHSFNLVRVSSIFPPNCLFVSRDEGLGYLSSGQIVFLVLSEGFTNEEGRIVFSSIGMAVSNDPTLFGYLAEHSGFGLGRGQIRFQAEALAVEMLATKLGLTVVKHRPGSGSAYLSGAQTVWTRSEACVGVGLDKEWMTVISAAVFTG